MITTTIEIGTLINRSPEIRGVRPIIAGTGVTVRRLVSWYKLGLTPEEISSLGFTTQMKTLFNQLLNNEQF